MSDPLVPSSLAAFLAVAQEGGFTAAARVHGLSQSALTVSVRKLEEELGTTLLVRTARGAALTSTGEALRRHALSIERTLAEARREIVGLEEEPRGRFTLGVHESLASYFLPGFMGRFASDHPGIEIQLHNANSREVLTAVVERRVDVGLVVHPDPHPDCVISRLFKDSMGIVGLDPLIGRRSARTVLETHALIHVPQLRQTQWILATLAQQDLRPSRELPCSSMELVKSLVLDGAGVGILPYRVAHHRVEPGRLRALAKGAPRVEDEISLVRRADLHVTRAARLLLDGLMARGADLR